MEIKEMNCKVCNHPLNIAKENAYIAKVKERFLSVEFVKKYNAVDCPYCGCQNLLRERFERAEK